MEILYKACDGRIFDDEDDCANYEIMLDIADKACALFATYQGKIFTIKDALSPDGEYGPEAVMYVYAPNLEAFATARDYIFEAYGLESPEWDFEAPDDAPQAWVYESKLDGWKSWASMVQDFYETKEIFEKMKEKA